MVLDERVATLSYRSQQSGAIVREQVERDKFSAQMIELMKKLPREQDVSLAILRWAGQPLLPAHEQVALTPPDARAARRAPGRDQRAAGAARRS